MKSAAFENTAIIHKLVGEWDKVIEKAQMMEYHHGKRNSLIAEVRKFERE